MSGFMGGDEIGFRIVAIQEDRQFRHAFANPGIFVPVLFVGDEMLKLVRDDAVVITGANGARAAAAFDVDVEHVLLVGVVAHLPRHLIDAGEK